MKNCIIVEYFNADTMKQIFLKSSHIFFKIFFKEVTNALRVKFGEQNVIYSTNVVSEIYVKTTWTTKVLFDRILIVFVVVVDL